MSTDPRDVPGWTQTFAQPDNSECILLRAMEGDGYTLTELELSETYAKLGGEEHIAMCEDLQRRAFCVMEQDEKSVTWKLTEQGRKALELA